MLLSLLLAVMVAFCAFLPVGVAMVLEALMSRLSGMGLVGLFIGLAILIPSFYVFMLDLMKNLKKSANVAKGRESTHSAFRFEFFKGLKITGKLYAMLLGLACLDGLLALLVFMIAKLIKSNVSLDSILNLIIIIISIIKLLFIPIFTSFFALWIREEKCFDAYYKKSAIKVFILELINIAIFFFIKVLGFNFALSSKG
jgi:hypothetical protein